MKHWILALGLSLCPPRAQAQFLETALTCLRNSQVVSDLQTMGIPAVVTLSDEPRDRRVTLYELNSSSPSALGVRLHEALERLDQRQRAQLQFKLARTDYASLEEAVRVLGNIVDLQDRGFAKAYPDLAQAYLDRAVEILKPDEKAPALPEQDKDSPSVRQVLLKHQRGLRAMNAVLGAARKAAPYLLGADSPALKYFDDAAAREALQLQEASQAIGALTGGKGQLTHRGLYGIVRTLPEERLNEAQWKALASSFPMGESINRLEVMGLWRAGIDGRGVRIGVIDDGTDVDHPDLAGLKVAANLTHERYLKGPNAGKPDDRGEHGTHVTGIIRALAPQAEIRVYKALENDSDKVPRELRHNSVQNVQAVAKAMQCAADDGCSVVNMSLGWNSGHPIDPDLLADQAKALGDRGITVVVASGNEGKGTGRSPGYSEHALTVGAVGYSGRQALSSSRNDVLRPDGQALKVMPKPDCLSYGVDVCSDRLDPDSKYVDPRKSSMMFSGTSMATPHVTAIVALIQQKAKQKGRELTPDEVRQLLRETGSQSKDGPYGVRVVDPGAALQRLEPK